MEPVSTTTLITAAIPARTVRSRSILRVGAPLVALFLLALPANAWGRAAHMVASTPAAETIMHGRNMQYIVRFDAPVDHVQSRLEILRDGNVVETLHPRVDSAPDVLFASAPAPAPGSYALHWTVKSMADQEISEGTIPFSVAP
jgi:methionine-rich copper-binding protein CopC